MTEIRLLLVDDEGLTRQTLRDYMSIDPDIEIVGEAADGRAAVLQTRALRPDVVLLDMQMPTMDGVEAARLIHEESPEIGILGLSTFSTDRYVVPLLRAGASGYLVKDSRPEEMVAAVRSVAAGDAVLSPQVTRFVVSGVADSVPATPVADEELLGALTERELEVIDLLAKGMSNKEIAAALYITESTVKARFVKVMAKLGVRDRVQILITALDRGLVPLPRSRRD
ncbi:response regulator transcription factor [Micrococcus yunnanensis]|uniref:response regulator n=1 Tax=Micrococcus yunnanensis TaxID=566027 RepID=UPI001071B198|nr:response regulator transcription factor [Micrococcus yunnanensis]MBF0745612.1 response regulator transcription factor [Micrococcus yunnanensis]TFU54157.1 response regulator transcription factor [Micrococcus yunnanensis]